MYVRWNTPFDAEIGAAEAQIFMWVIFLEHYFQFIPSLVRIGCELYFYRSPHKLTAWRPGLVVARWSRSTDQRLRVNRRGITSHLGQLNLSSFRGQ